MVGGMQSGSAVQKAITFLPPFCLRKQWRKATRKIACLPGYRVKNRALSEPQTFTVHDNSAQEYGGIVDGRNTKEASGGHVTGPSNAGGYLHFSYPLGCLPPLSRPSSPAPKRTLRVKETPLETHKPPLSSDTQENEN